jgi:hypothetical protein
VPKQFIVPIDTLYVWSLVPRELLGWVSIEYYSETVSAANNAASKFATFWKGKVGSIRNVMTIRNCSKIWKNEGITRLRLWLSLWVRDSFQRNISRGPDNSCVRLHLYTHHKLGRFCCSIIRSFVNFSYTFPNSYIFLPSRFRIKSLSRLLRVLPTTI